jgi:hypothetical protein
MRQRMQALSAPRRWCASVTVTCLLLASVAVTCSCLLCLSQQGTGKHCTCRCSCALLCATCLCCAVTGKYATCAPVPCRSQLAHPAPCCHCNCLAPRARAPVLAALSTSLVYQPCLPRASRCTESFSSYQDSVLACVCVARDSVLGCVCVCVCVGQ